MLRSRIISKTLNQNTRRFTTTIMPIRTRNRFVNVALVSSLVLAGSYMFTEKTSSDTGSANYSKGRQVITKLTPSQVTSWIRENEESYIVERGKGVMRYDVCQLASNNPIEDDRSEKIVQVPVVTSNDERISSDWMFWGVYDGHSGWTTSAKLRDSLIQSVLSEIDKVYVKSSPNSTYRLLPNTEQIDNAIQQGFLKLDDEIVNKSVEKLLQNPAKSGATELIAPALSGSCGLLSMYDSYSKNLRVAVTGDSRAVLGSKKDGQWTAKALTTDQTGSNVDEANRIRSEHPGEESTCVRNGRVLGMLEPTRAFGDARFKWTRETQHKIASAFFGRRTPNELKSPPYVTAKPEITTTKVNDGDFMVIGSDGLFEMLSNEEIVSLVAQWMEYKQPEYNPVEPEPSMLNKLFGSKKKPTYAVEDVSGNKDSMKQQIRRRNGYIPSFVVEDDNCATHLIRNALGGGDREQVSMLVSIPSPLSRNYRDDLTVTVVFFGQDGEPNDAGPIKVNQLATHNNLTTRSKL